MELENGEIAPSSDSDYDGCVPKAYQEKEERKRRFSSSSSSSQLTWSDSEEDRPMWKTKSEDKTKKSKSRRRRSNSRQHSREPRKKLEEKRKCRMRNSSRSSSDSLSDKKRRRKDNFREERGDYRTVRENYRGRVGFGYRGGYRGRGYYRGRYPHSRAYQNGTNRTNYSYVSQTNSHSESEDCLKETYACSKCGEPQTSMKALAHHEIKSHGLEIDCNICSEKFNTSDDFRKHFETEHYEDRVGCSFCKIVFERPNDMSDHRWDFVASHFYGEVFYYKISVIEEKEGK